MDLLKPFDGNFPVTQTFDEHVARRIKNGWRYYNGGIDWAMPMGTPLKAAADGVVSDVGMDKTGYGLHIRIKFGVYTLIYGHLDEVFVKKGDEVKRGEFIARSDSTGNSTGPHLHFELRKGTTAIDPMPLIVNGTVDAEDETPQDFPDIPDLPKIVTHEEMNVRIGPTVGAEIIDLLPIETSVSVQKFVKDKKDVWAKIGYRHFVAVYHGGRHYCSLVKT